MTSSESSSFLQTDFLECGICGSFFEDAHEAPCCNTIYCKACVSEWLQKNTSCPDCRAFLTVTKLRPNKPIQRMVDNLPIECSNEGCTASITRGILPQHLPLCEYGIVPCSNWQEVKDQFKDKDGCGEMPRKSLEQHVQKECEFRMVDCPNECGIRMRLFKVQEHCAGDCENTEETCFLNCGVAVRRLAMRKHLDSECPHRVFPCKYSNLGCTFTGKEAEHQVHIKDDLAKHFEYSLSTIAKQKTKIASLHVEINKMASKEFLYKKTLKSMRTCSLQYSPFFETPSPLPQCFVLPKDETISKMIHFSNGQDNTQNVLYYQPVTMFNRDKVQPITLHADASVEHVGAVYYFELEVLQDGKDGAIGIGMGDAAYIDTVNKQMPGWYGETFGYHSDDGKKFCKTSNGRGESYGPTWNKAMTVGCGWDQARGVIFFTRNASYLGDAFEGVMHGNLSPIIGFSGINAKVNVNFGSQQFKFPISQLDLIVGCTNKNKDNKNKKIRC